jgi:hypothetical protein
LKTATARNPFLQHEPAADTEDRHATAQKIQQIRDLQVYVPHIIAAGVLEGDDAVETIAKTIGHEQLFADALVALGDRLEAAGIDATMPNPTRDDPESCSPLEDAMLSRAIEWGHAGYWLGLAVGMQLGPHAFDGEQ